MRDSSPPLKPDVSMFLGLVLVLPINPLLLPISETAAAEDAPN